jgi:hypothetical protein
MNALPGYAADASALFAWLPLMALGIPLLLASLLAVPRLRAVTARTALWAATPALLTALSAPDTALALPAVLLGSSLELDVIGRPLLLAVAVLWLVAGLLGRAELHRTGQALLYLLAMSGTFAMTLAGDLSLFLLASTVAGYSLYGLLDGRGGAPLMIKLLVLSDLLVFELLVLLAHAGEGLAFASLPASIAAANDNGLLLILLLLGFGAKAGLLGLHYWLAPSIDNARPEQRLALVAVVLTAGLLPWTRLLAPGAIVWPEAAQPVQWLALATAGYALAAGLLQRRFGALAGYGIMAMTALWLALLGAAMSDETAAESAAATLSDSIAQSGLVLGALLLIGMPTPGRWRWLRAATVTAGALLLVDAVLAALALSAISSHPTPHALPVLALICAATGILLGRMLRLTLSGDQSPEAEAKAPTVPAGLLLILAAALMATGHAGAMAVPWREAGALLLGAGVGALLEPLVRRLPSIPPGDLARPIAMGLNASGQHIRRGLIARLVHWRARLRSQLAWASSTDALREGLGATESALRIWRTAILLVLTTAAIAAALLLIAAASA